MAKISNLFKSSKSRNAMMLFVIIFVVVAFVGFYMFRQDKIQTAGRAKVAKAPADIQYEPGAEKVSKEYLKTLLQSEKMSSERALKKGTSAVPSLIGGGSRAATSGQSFQAQSDSADFCTRVQACASQQESTTALLNRYVQQGQIPALTAAKLSRLQDEGASVEDYAKGLNQLVTSGEITPEQAKKLLDTYRQEHAVKQLPSSKELVNDMLGQGQVTPTVASSIRKLASSGEPIAAYSSELNRMVKAGELTPEQASALLSAYKRERTGVIAPTSGQSAESTGGSTTQATGRTSSQPQATNALLAQLQQEGKIPGATAAALKTLSDDNVPAGEYAAKLNALVSDGQLNPAVAKQLLAKYRAEHGDTSVQTTGVPASFAQQQRQQQKQELQQQAEKLEQQAAAIQAQRVAAQTAQTHKTMQALAGEMSAQARQMLTSWNAVPQRLIIGPIDTKPSEQKGLSASDKQGQSGNDSSVQGPLVKVGTIMFAVLDTAVNSDRPGPIMATIVSGKLKGGKLLGGITQTPDGQRVILKFNLMNMQQWSSAANISAYAINPDTARTAIASDVDNHYLSRYGALFAANFIKGYANAVAQSGQTTVTNSGTTTTTNPNLSSKEKLYMGLGEVGKQMSSSVKEYFNRKPTVTVDAGVGIGILFMEPVKQPS